MLMRVSRVQGIGCRVYLRSCRQAWQAGCPFEASSPVPVLPLRAQACTPTATPGNWFLTRSPPCPIIAGSAARGRPAVFTPPQPSGDTSPPHTHSNHPVPCTLAPPPPPHTPSKPCSAGPAGGGRVCHHRVRCTRSRPQRAPLPAPAFVRAQLQ